MRSEDGHLTLVFNGEIYDHADLRRALEAKGYVFRSRSDTEVLLKGYIEYGGDVVHAIDGMFAFAIYDARARSLFAARDRVGKKPFFYTRLGGGELRFASEIKALAASGVPLDVDETALPSILELGHPLPPKTPYRNILELPPASSLRYDGVHAPEIRRFWKAPFLAPPLDIADDEAVAETRRLVERAVRRRMEADVPVGAFLSGGIDSTVVVASMAKESTRRVRTYSIGFGGAEGADETEFARIAAKAFDTEHTEFHVTPSSIDAIEQVVRLHDGPFGDSTTLPTAILARLTREHVTVALSGDGGDELFCGYPRAVATALAETIPSPLRALTRVALGGQLPPPGRRRKLARAHRLAMVASQDLVGRTLALHSYLDPSSVLRNDLKGALPVHDAHDWVRALYAAPSDATPLARVLDFTFETYLAFDLLPKADRATMAHALELRSPLLDVKLTEFAARLPDRFRRRGRTLKWVLKEAFRGSLPPVIAARGKMGFGMPLGAWFASELRDYVRERLLPSDAAIYRYLDPTAIRSIVDDHTAGRADFGHALWLLLTIEVWLQTLRTKPS
jgi:asparagine synthase (glutamine-hydrolysing)